jgi:predicted ATPase
LLFDALQEALLVTGDFSRLSSIIEQPLIFGRNFEDKLNIYNNLVRSLGSSGKTEEAITTAIAVLAQLGEVVPTNITADIYSDEVTNIKRLLHDKSKHDLLSLPMMVDVHKLAAMQFLNHAVIMAYASKPAIMPIIAFRMIKLSIEHGGQRENVCTCLACDV